MTDRDMNLSEWEPKEKLEQLPPIRIRTASKLRPDNLPDNPAKYSDAVLDCFRRNLPRYLTLGTELKCIDPFGGVGKIHELQDTFPGVSFFAMEIETLWAAHDGRNIQGDVLNMHRLYPPDYFDFAVTSPPYGNRMADDFEAKDGSKRHTYRHYLGQPLDNNNIGNLQWTDRRQRYQMAMTLAWVQLRQVLKHDAIFAFNCKDHIRNGKRMQVVDWHDGVLQTLGFTRLRAVKVKTPGQRHGENGEKRVDHEVVIFYQLDKYAGWNIQR